MSLLLPQNPEIRDLVDVARLVDFQRLPTFREAKHGAVQMFESDSAVSRVFAQSIRANGDIHLLSFGPRGGVKVLWNFGDPLKIGGGLNA